MFVSTDQGATWSTTNNALTGLKVTALAVVPGTPTSLLAGTASSGIFFSSNQAVTFTAKNAGLDTLQITALAIDPNTVNGVHPVYAGTKVFGFYQSFDDLVSPAFSWNAFNKGLPGDVVTPPNITVTALAIDQFSDIYMGGSPTVSALASGKAIQPLVEFSAGLPTLNVAAIAIDRNTPATVYAGLSDGGVAKTINSGLTWKADSGVTLGAFNKNRLTNFNVTALAISSTSTNVYAGFFQNLVPTADAFVTAINPAGTALTFSTYLGGNQDDVAQGIALPPILPNAISQNNVYITGYTNSGAFVVNPLSKQNIIHRGGTFGYDAFVTRLNPTTSSLVYSTFLGGGAAVTFRPTAVRKATTTATASPSTATATPASWATRPDRLPHLDTAFQSGFGDGLNQGDALWPASRPIRASILRSLARPRGAADYASYLGGGGDDAGLAIALDPSSTSTSLALPGPPISAGQSSPGHAGRQHRGRPLLRCVHHQDRSDPNHHNVDHPSGAVGTGSAVRGRNADVDPRHHFHRAVRNRIHAEHLLRRPDCPGHRRLGQ